MRICNTALAAALLTMMAAASASAQVGGPYDIHWNMQGSGGETFAVGGPYRLGMANAQPAADQLSGGSYTLAGGFWGPTTAPSVDVDGGEPPLPLAFAVRLEGPNPFQNSTSVRFELPEPRPVSIQVYGIDGRRVRDLVSATFAAGRHAAYWDGTDRTRNVVASGVYFARVVAGASSATLRLVCLH